MNRYVRRLAQLSLWLIFLITPKVADAALPCYDCHGSRDGDIRPVDTSANRDPETGGFKGSHRTHLGSEATQSSCAKCHPGSDSYTASHRDGAIRLGSRLNNSPLATPYNNRTTAWPQTASPEAGSCSSVNCHFESGTPRWGTTSTDTTCNTCHSSPPTDGGHGKKHGLYFGNDTNSCAKCHSDHAAEAAPFSHATSAGRRPLAVEFTTFPNQSTNGFYTGDVSYPKYLPSQSPARNGSCNNTYCHSNARKDGSGNYGQPNRPVTWSGETTKCFSCHKGLSTNPDPKLAPAQTSDSTFANCSTIFGVWSSSKGYCTPGLTMSSNGHHRLVGPQWVRKYPCYYCHSATMNPNGTLKNHSSHVNGRVDIKMADKWKIGNRAEPSYDRSGKSCDNVYCHSDGTTDPETVRKFAWTEPKTKCNTCHGHPSGACSNGGCHDGKVHPGDPTQKLWTLPETFGNQSSYSWPAGQEWKNALPMFKNEGPLSSRPNSHPRHAQTNFTCDNCHSKTVLNGTCTECHKTGVPTGNMSEVSHIDASYHVNKKKDVYFKNEEASYDIDTKTCSNTLCHPPGDNPVWGSSHNSVTCLGCHGTSSGDVDDFDAFNGIKAKINKTQWEERGHGRGRFGAYTSAYPVSLNPPANFPGNPCWYCHDNTVIHKDPNNPFRLKMHPQYAKRFEKECVYCHMEGTNTECLSCHVGQTESLSPQATASGIAYKYKFKNLSTRIEHPEHTYLTDCISGGCHDSDTGKFPNGNNKRHNTNAGNWTAEMKKDIRNQYLMMGVCLQCHDDDSSNQCTSCHISPDSNPMKYSLGYDPGTGYIKPVKARASAGHFGHKHYEAFKNSGGWLKHYTSAKSPIFGTYSVVNGTWKGGKFCWDCHDPHGDSNIYMIQSKVATSTDGIFGIPRTRESVVFTGNAASNYVKKDTSTTYGICNVCHTTVRHYTRNSIDSHNSTRRCTGCHEHRFADSHANKQACNSCHANSKPVPKHTAFGLPRDCTKCHSGPIGRRMDIMGQMKANSHHVQGVEVNNKHCYACHWEATAEGLINLERHAGFNYRNYTSIKDAAVDLVIWKAGIRPTFYSSSSATTFVATNIAVDGDLQRTEVAKITNHCLSCHSDQNNDTTPFNDRKTPRQYAWDLQSIASRYAQTGSTKVTTWGKYSTATTNKKKKVIKAFSAHGNAMENSGGAGDTTNGLDSTITNTRGGTSNKNVQCFDCHNSHGSKAVGTTSSYITFNGSNNGANLKETKRETGGYANDYKASSNSSGVNPFGTGAGQCFDCHTTAATGSVVPNGKTPWGYNSTFGATAPIMGYKDTLKFGNPTKPSEIKASTVRFSERDSRQTIMGGHLKASIPTGALANLAKETGTASSGTTTTMTDSTKAWPTTTSVNSDTTVSVSNALYNPFLSNNQNTRKPASGYWSPPNGQPITQIHITNASETNWDYFNVYDASNTQVWRGSGSFNGWVSIAPTTGIYTVFTSDGSAQVGVGGDVPEVITTQTTTVPYSKWQNLYILMTSGNNNGMLRKITGNTANSLTFEAFNYPVAANDTYKIVPYSTTIGGLCTPCHDPHGVSTTLGDKQPYAVPLLKGTWMTSPYKEDGPPPFPTGDHNSQTYTGAGGFNGKPRAWGRYYTSDWNQNHPTPTQPSVKYNLDRTTFGGSTRISEKDDQFAGLCLNCHSKPSLTDGINRNNGASGFRTVDRIHEAVKGWGVNSEHSFTCSKCHQPHNSGLPRLMQTNCLDYNHRGGIASGGQPWAADKVPGNAHTQGGEHRGFPIGSLLPYNYSVNNGRTWSNSFEATTACHISRFSPTYSTTPPAQWPAENRWNNITPW